MSKKNVSLNIQEFQDLNLKELFSKILNILALIERKHFVENNPDEKANGFFDDINNCVLDSDLFALIVDGKHIKLKTKTSVYSYIVYSAVGISLEGKKQIVSIDICEGRESLDGWRAFFKRLLNRGLRRVLIVVHDDFPGLSNLVNTFFPHTDDQICTVHLLRNLKKELSPLVY